MSFSQIMFMDVDALIQPGDGLMNIYNDELSNEVVARDQSAYEAKGEPGKLVEEFLESIGSHGSIKIYEHRSLPPSRGSILGELLITAGGCLSGNAPGDVPGSGRLPEEPPSISALKNVSQALHPLAALFHLAHSGDRISELLRFIRPENTVIEKKQ